MTDQERRARVVREDDRVWLDVEGFDAGEMCSSVHGAPARILEVLDEPLSYEQLICYSGLAFRAQVHKTMCPSAGHPCCGFECLKNSCRAFPWRALAYESFPWDKPKKNRKAFEQEVREAVRKSIDRGIPVHYSNEEDGLIVGYGDEGQRWLCLHPYHKNGRERFWYDEVKGFAGGKWPWAVVVWIEPKPDDERATPRDLTVAALRQAVTMWSAGKHEDYIVGDAAYTHWLGWLRSVEDGSEKDPKAGMQGNGWCYDTLVHYRRIAAEWLKQAASDFDGEVGEQLLVAAREYGAIAELLMRDLKCPWDLAMRPDRFEAWTSALRQDEIRRLEAARERDRAAIRAIEQALKAL